MIRNAPRDVAGAPFPTTYWLTCPEAVKTVARLEAAGAIAGFNEQERSDPAFAQALQLLLGWRISHHQAIQLLVQPGFHDEGSLHKTSITDSVLGPLLKLPVDDGRNQRVHNGIQAVKFGAVGKYQGGQLGAIHAI